MCHKLNGNVIVAAQKLCSLRLGEQGLHCYMYKLAAERMDVKFNQCQDLYNFLITKSLSNKVPLGVSKESVTVLPIPFHQARPGSFFLTILCTDSTMISQNLHMSIS